MPGRKAGEGQKRCWIAALVGLPIRIAAVRCCQERGIVRRWLCPS